MVYAFGGWIYLLFVARPPEGVIGGVLNELGVAVENFTNNQNNLISINIKINLLLYHNTKTDLRIHPD